MILIWALITATWAGHVAMCFLPAAAAYNLLVGHASAWTQLIMAAALLPQLVLIPWAWRDSVTRVVDARARFVWRLFFFLTGFVAITGYALRYRPGRGPDRS